MRGDSIIHSATAALVRQAIDRFTAWKFDAGERLLVVFNWLIRWWGDDSTLEARLAAAVDVFLEGCVS